MLAEFEAFIPYGQINLFRLEEPHFNLWNHEYSAQGFAWRDGSVSLGVPDHDGLIWISIDWRERRQPVRPTALRALRVPFTIGQDDHPPFCTGG